MYYTEHDYSTRNQGPTLRGKFTESGPPFSEKKMLGPYGGGEWRSRSYLATVAEVVVEIRPKR